MLPKPLSLLLGAALVMVACGKDKPSPTPPAEETESLACDSNSDCERGWACLDGECANTAAGAIYTDPSSAVTPAKVKSEIERIQENSQKRADDILEGL